MKTVLIAIIGLSFVWGSFASLEAKSYAVREIEKVIENAMQVVAIHHDASWCIESAFGLETLKEEECIPLVEIRQNSSSKVE